MVIDRPASPYAYELPNNISEYKPEILAKIATVFDKLCTQIE